MPIEVINYSEFNTLAQCEQRWAYAYRDREEEQGARPGLHLGTLLHQGYGLWLAGAYADGAWLPPEWMDDMGRGGKPGELLRHYLHDFDPALVSKALWLLRRFVEHYGSTTPSSWNVIAAEQWMRTYTAGFELVGRPDGLAEIEGDELIPDGLWLIETKSYGAKGRLDYIQVDPQLVIYKELVESTYGRELTGVLYEGIYTYQWTPEKPTQAVLIEQAEADGAKFATKTLAREWAKNAQDRHPGIERPAAASFERRWVDISEHQVRTGDLILASSIRRRDVLREHEVPIPNIGQACKACGYKPRCWAALSGIEEPEDPEIEFDESLEPV